MSTSAVALTCPGCHSAEVKSIGSDSYRCDYCGTQFQHRDPSVSRVEHTHRDQHCGCGHRAEAQCVECGTQLCHDHNALRQSDPALGPFLQSRLAGVNVLCSTHLTPHLEEYARQVKAGRLCAGPGCLDVGPRHKCACCKRHHCELHAETRRYTIQWGQRPKDALMVDSLAPVCEACDLRLQAAVGQIHQPPEDAPGSVRRKAKSEAQQVALRLRSQFEGGAK